MARPKCDTITLRLALGYSESYDCEYNNFIPVYSRNLVLSAINSLPSELITVQQIHELHKQLDKTIDIINKDVENANAIR